MDSSSSALSDQLKADFKRLYFRRTFNLDEKAAWLATFANDDTPVSSSSPNSEVYHADISFVGLQHLRARRQTVSHSYRRVYPLRIVLGHKALQQRGKLQALDHLLYVEHRR